MLAYAGVGVVLATLVAGGPCCCPSCSLLGGLRDVILTAGVALLRFVLPRPPIGRQPHSLRMPPSSQLTLSGDVVGCLIFPPHRCSPTQLGRRVMAGKITRDYITQPMTNNSIDGEGDHHVIPFHLGAGLGVRCTVGAGQCLLAGWRPRRNKVARARTLVADSAAALAR